MPLFLVVLLALVQGITEFLPVSSSAHLVLVHAAFGEHRPQEAAALVLDVAAHLGTLGAVLVYFRRDIVRLVRAGLAGLAGPRPEGWALGWQVAAAAVPVAVAGALLKDSVAADVRTVKVIAWTTLVFGLLLWAADRWGRRNGSLRRFACPVRSASHGDQFLSPLRGQALGHRHDGGADAGFLGPRRRGLLLLLLSDPRHLLDTRGRGARDLFGRWGEPDDRRRAGVLRPSPIAAALAAIAAMMRWLARSSFTPFVVYRVLLGGLLLAWVYS